MEKEIFKCKFCSESFTPKRKWQEFCDDKCRNNFHNDKKLIASGDIPPPVICPHCTSTNQIEKLSSFKLGQDYSIDKYLCSTCSKEFFIDGTNPIK